MTVCGRRGLIGPRVQSRVVGELTVGCVCAMILALRLAGKDAWARQRNRETAGAIPVRVRVCNTARSNQILPWHVSDMKTKILSGRYVISSRQYIISSGQYMKSFGRYYNTDSSRRYIYSSRRYINMSWPYI